MRLEFIYNINSIEYSVLSGGSTMFKDFGRRLQRDVNKLINNRIKVAAELSNATMKPEPMRVEVN